MARPKGLPKTGGRTKGIPNKRTTAFRDLLEENDIDFEKLIANSLKSKDVEFLKVLQGFMPYLQPRMKEADTNNNTNNPNQDELLEHDTATLLKLAESGSDG